jgi:kynurenine formamidase
MDKRLIVVLAVLAGIAPLAAAGGRKDAAPDLWGALARAKADYRWVDLTLELGPDTPHWHGFGALEAKPLYTFEETGVFLSYQYTLPGQYGTHVDLPAHFDPHGRPANEYGVQELAFPLVVIDKSEAVAANANYVLSKRDVLEFEARYGAIPEGALVAFRSGWSARPPSDYENPDEAGASRYPGWGLDALRYLVEERNIAAVGHETPDTDSALTGRTAGFVGEDYVLDSGRLTIELLANLDRVPPTGAIAFAVFPKLKGGTGFTSRVFAIAPR